MLGRKKKNVIWIACKLIDGDRRECVADRQIGDDEQERQRARARTSEPTIGTRNSKVATMRMIAICTRADDDIGRDLAEHDLGRPHRHGEQRLHRAALDLARHRQRGVDQHGHGEDRADQSGHDVAPRLAGRIVAPMHAQLEGRRHFVRATRAARSARGRAPARRRRRRPAIGADGRGRIGGVGDEQQRRPLAADHAPARKSGGI